MREHAINQIAKGDAAEGTLLSSGVIFTPLSEISTSGKSPASAIALTSSRRDARSVKRLLMYSWQSAGTARVTGYPGVIFQNRLTGSDNHRNSCSGVTPLPRCHLNVRLLSVHSARKIRNIFGQCRWGDHNLSPAFRDEPDWRGRRYFSELFSIHISDGIQCVTELHCGGCSPELQHGQHPGAYLRSVLYFSVIRCNGSKLSLRDRNRVSSTLLMNSCRGRTSSIAAQDLPRTLWR
nr:Uncharacterised protein [Klebsiella pneumoniae]